MALSNGLRRMALLWELVVLLLCFVAQGQIRVLSPKVLVDRFNNTNGQVLGSTATFGAPYYGERLMGQLQYGISQGKSHCTKNDYSISGMNAALENGFQQKLITIVVVDSGTCSYVTKVRVAEEKGAHAVIIVDDGVETKKSIQKVILPDDGYGDRIKIPSILITSEDGTRLKHALMSYQEPVLVELSWDIPARHVVTMDMWMSSASREDMTFLTAFQQKAQQFGKTLRFIPHFYVFSMPADYNDLCSDGTARFCAEDPDGSGPITGAMVLREDVRQLCILQVTQQQVDGLAGATAAAASMTADIELRLKGKLPEGWEAENMMRKHGGYHASWWKYVVEFSTRCPLDAAPPHRFGDMCSKEVMHSISSIKSLDVEDCVVRSSDIKLEEQKLDAAWSPRAIRINGWRYDGPLDVNLVTKALCSGFKLKPNACDEHGHVFDLPYIPASDFGFGQLILILLVVVSIFFVVLFAYKRFLENSLHKSMREEVVLEIHSTMSSYKELSC
eukprot:gnl/MRDRNA2_/MRDRNA2_31786_c0_seq1.p1 gnl/MRDRNA2_/MRDRNA2_31786_c0~~gnl/MRDRNA2_/MRDRNA2_31786_c0_seq1.p1  ORF type:complete len:518 (-),score=89.32 gnl/MRDRNA2_/MRDRNA2_31786_c0_seq1:429-1937(-)